MIPPTSIDGTDITGATIDGTDVQEITVDGDVVFSAGGATINNFPVAYSNLVAWYPFDSAFYGGSNADDVTAIAGGSGDDTAYDGTVSGASYQSSGGADDLNAGAGSGFYSFDGSNDTISTPQIPIGNYSEITLTAWVYYANTSNVGYIVNIGSANPDDDITLWVDSSMRVRMFEKINNNFDFAGFGSQSVFTGQWYHIAGVIEESGFIGTYTNGNLNTSTNNMDNDFSDIDTPNIYIGSRDDQGNYTNADIDDVRVYNTALSQSQINSIYQNTDPN